MTRMYLSPVASAGAKIGLILIECLIGLYNLASFPIRKVTPKIYSLAVAISGGLYTFKFFGELSEHLAAFAATAVGLAIGVFIIKLVHKILNQKIGPKIAFMINSPFGIRLNRYYTPM